QEPERLAPGSWFRGCEQWIRNLPSSPLPEKPQCGGRARRERAPRRPIRSRQNRFCPPTLRARQTGFLLLLACQARTEGAQRKKPPRDRTVSFRPPSERPRRLMVRE